MKKYRFIFYFLLVATISGCGQSGPLYLPQPGQAPPEQTPKYGF